MYDFIYDCVFNYPTEIACKLSLTSSFCEIPSFHSEVPDDSILRFSAEGSSKSSLVPDEASLLEVQVRYQGPWGLDLD